MFKGQVRLTTYLSTGQNHSSGASGHRFCLIGQVDFVIRLVDSVQNFPKEIIIIIVVSAVVILDLPLVLQILAGTFPMTAS